MLLYFTDTVSLLSVAVPLSLSVYFVAFVWFWCLNELDWSFFLKPTKCVYYYLRHLTNLVFNNGNFFFSLTITL